MNKPERSEERQDHDPTATGESTARGRPRSAVISLPPTSSPPVDVPAGKIIELRALLAQKFPVAKASPCAARLPTGVELLDRGLEGGLPKGALTEVICPQPGTGSGTLIQALIEARQAAGTHLALVDASDCFDPDGMTNVQLAALLWVRCQGPEQAVKAADLLCRDNNLPLVVLDLALCTARQVRAIASAYWYRLQRVAEGNGSVALVFTPARVVASAACTLRLTRRLDLRALDVLRDELGARLQVEAVRTRAFATPETAASMPALMVG